MGQAAPPSAAQAAAEKPPPAKRVRLQASHIGSPANQEPAAQGAKLLQAFPAAAEAAAAAAMALPQARPAVQAKWGSFLAEEDELQLEDEEASPPPAEPRRHGGWGSAARAAAPAAAAQRWHQLLPQQGKQQKQQGISQGAWQPSLSAAVAAEALGQGETSSFGDTPPGGSACLPGFRPIVRPLQAGNRVAVQPVHLPGQPKQPQHHNEQQQQQQRHAAWPAPQRLPLQPSRQQPAQQMATGGGGNAGTWKAPLVRHPPTGEGASAGRPPVTASTRTGPVPGAAPGSWNQLVDGLVQLGWPTAEEAARPARRVAVPDAFASSQQYVQVWSNALLEELNLRQVQSLGTRCHRLGAPQRGRPACRKCDPFAVLATVAAVLWQPAGVPSVSPRRLPWDAGLLRWPKLSTALWLGPASCNSSSSGSSQQGRAPGGRAAGVAVARLAAPVAAVWRRASARRACLITATASSLSGRTTSR